MPWLPPLWLMAALALLTAIRLWVAAQSGLVEDEAYYRLWALAPSFGYFDHAPMVAWWMALGRGLLGDTALGLRLLAPLATALGSLALWRTGALLFGPKVATRAVVWFNAMVLIGAGALLMTPDTPSVLFWGLTLWAVAELDRSRAAGWWLLIGLLAGLGLDSKYTGLFLGAGIVVWLAALPANRAWFKAWQLWAGGVIAVLLFVPIIAWNAGHGWASFHKQFGRAVVSVFEPLMVLDFLGVQAVLLLPLIAPFVVWGGWITLRDGWRRRDGGALLPVLSSAPFLVYLLLHGLHDHVEGNWPAPLYAPAALMAAVAVARVPTLAAGPWRDFVAGAARAAAPFGYALSALLYLYVLLPVSWLPATIDPTAQMRGWADFAAEVEAKRIAVGADWIATASYAITGELALTVPAPTAVIQLTERIRYGHLPTPDPRLTARPALFVGPDTTADLATLKARYRDVQPLGTIMRAIRGAPLSPYRLYRVAEPYGDPLAAINDRTTGRPDE